MFRNVHAKLVLGWVTKYEYPLLQQLFFLFFPFLCQGDIKGLQNCRPCVMSFLLFINILFLILPWPYLCLFIYIRKNKQRDKSFNPGFSVTFEVEGHRLVSRQVLCKTEGRRPEPLGGSGGMLPRKIFRT